MLDDAFEFLSYLVDTWRYILSSAYRESVQEEWRSGNAFERLLLLLRLAISLVCGVVAPAYLIWWIFFG